MLKAPVAAAALIALAGLAAAAAWHAQDLPRDYNSTLGERISRIYTMATMQAWRRDGPLAHGFQGQLLNDPENKDLTLPYANHPPLVLSWHHLIERILGPGDRSMRFGAFLWSHLALIALLFFWRDPKTRLFGAVALGILASSSGLMAHGDLACVPLFGLPLMTWLAVAAAHYRHNGSSLARLITLLVLPLALLADWDSWALAAIIAADQLLSPSPWRARLRFLFAMILLGILASGLLFASIWAAYGDFDAMKLAFSRVSGVMDAGSLTYGGHLSTLRLLCEQAIDLFGWLLIGVATLGLFLPVKEALKTPRHAARLYCLGALLALLILRTRAVGHPFWIMVMTPGLALSASVAVARLLPEAGDGARKAAWRIAAALVLAGLLITSGHIETRDFASRTTLGQDAATARVLERGFGPKDILIGFTMTDQSIRASMDPTLLVLIPPKEQTFQEILDLYGAERLAQASGLHLLFPHGIVAVLEEFPELATWLPKVPRKLGPPRHFDSPIPYESVALDLPAILAARAELGRK